jgi:hypothetical protein
MRDPEVLRFSGHEAPSCRSDWPDWVFFKKRKKEKKRKKKKMIEGALL